MNTTRILTTLAAAAAMTGGIGFAYAQTASDAKQPPASTTAMPSSSESSSTPAATSTDSSTVPTESAPKADRG